MTIRPATAADAAALERICLLTGAAGTDATGMFTDDTALADVYATPYLYGPGCFALVWDVDGEARGYIVGTDDTVAFQRWFVAEWWPRVGGAHRPRTEADGWLLPSAADPRRMLIDEVAEYPAHLHIDLMPELQGRGLGRRLIDTLRATLAERGVPALHLGIDAANVGARAFYERLGFHELTSSRPDAPRFGIATG